MREGAAASIAWLGAARMERLLLGTWLCAAILMGLGSAWDSNWHGAIGRDSFWIPPHMLIYSGAALAGAAACVGVVRAGAGGRTPGAGPGTLATASRTIALGVATMLGAAVFDEIWHRTVGDRTIWSPPHVLGVVGGIVIGLGAATAILHATRDGTVPRSWAPAALVSLVAGILVAAYFGLRPAAIMTCDPGRDFRFFATQDAYVVAVLASLTIAPIVAGSRAALGPGGFGRVAAAGAGLWALQEGFHLVATPVAAAAFGYAPRPDPYPDLPFELRLLAFVLVPALLADRLPVRRAWLAGAAAGGLWVAGVWIWLLPAQLARPPGAAALIGAMILGATGAAAGARLGARIR